MFFSTNRILDSIERLKSVHPFLGITFLACKKGNLPIGKTMECSMDAMTKKHMDTFHKICPESEYYFQPFRSNDRKKKWVSRRYPSSGLQAINTQLNPNPFTHPPKSTSWGWEKKYLESLAFLLVKNKKLSIIDMAIWIFRDREWDDSTQFEDIIDHFVKHFQITPAEKEALFSEEINHIKYKSLFQDNKTSWNDLKKLDLPSPPDASPDRGAILSLLELTNVGPTSGMYIEPKPRLNIITGDNGLGKTFLMDCAWWAFTGDWAGNMVYPKLDVRESIISYNLASGKIPTYPSNKESAVYDVDNGEWVNESGKKDISGLVVYARVDGSYAVWDPAMQYGHQASPCAIFSREVVWNGDNKGIEGLVRDWVRWQSASGNPTFKILTDVLKTMSPPDLGELTPGKKPVRLLGDSRDVPTIKHSYGTIPILHASAGVKRILTLAYLIVWAWHEHNVRAGQKNIEPEERMVILIDEIEAHLHPKWQRTILPALLKIQKILSKTLEIQFIVSTHSPLVLASVETYFNEETDQLFHLKTNSETHDAEISEEEFIRHGQVDLWLTSDIFGLEEARSKEAEIAIKRARELQLEDEPDADEVDQVHAELVRCLAQNDTFWPRWIFFAEKHGVRI